MSFWQHQLQPPQPKKPKPPSVSQIKELLLDYHGITPEAIANLTIEEDRIDGYAKGGKYWYKFTIYTSALSFYV